MVFLIAGFVLSCPDLTPLLLQGHESFPYSPPPMPVMESAPTVVEHVPLVMVQVRAGQELDGNMDASNNIFPAGCKNFKKFKKVRVPN